MGEPCLAIVDFSQDNLREHATDNAPASTRTSKNLKQNGRMNEADVRNVALFIFLRPYTL
jgi:hypothetical protein